MKNYLNQIGRLDESYVKLAQQNYEQSRKKSVCNARQKVNGKTYAGKTKKCLDMQKVAKGAMITVMLVGLGYGASTYNTVTDYNVASHKVASEELSSAADELNYQNYQNIQKQDKTIFDKIADSNSTLNQISAEKKELKETGDYGFWDQNKLRDDAINNVARENTISSIKEAEEYTNGGISK